jgi:hypothetical protein
MMLRTRLIPIVLILLAAGCGGGAHRIAPVSGKITLDGKPLNNASVLFGPIGSADNKEPGPSAVGKTDAEGRFSLMAVDGSMTPGAVVGKNKVVITAGANDDPNDPKRTFHKQLPAKYNRNSTLVFDVPAEGTDAANFELSSKP